MFFLTAKLSKNTATIALVVIVGTALWFIFGHPVAFFQTVVSPPKTEMSINCGSDMQWEVLSDDALFIGGGENPNPSTLYRYPILVLKINSKEVFRTGLYDGVSGVRSDSLPQELRTYNSDALDLGIKRMVATIPDSKLNQTQRSNVVDCFLTRKTELDQVITIRSFDPWTTVEFKNKQSQVI